MNRWKYAILVSFVLAAVIVPSPDLHTMRVYAAAILALIVGVVWAVRGSTSS
jgi:Sec-independent protein secretion pathway component TatC